MTRIGLEIHCQLTSLQSKLFCPCKADYREFKPNANICPICMGIPGSLPRLNQEAVKKATTIAMALNCKTPDSIVFFRKNYFYPDLPKNFQITQLNIYEDTSIGGSGSVMVGDKKINISRIQLEEDPGRLIYEGSSAQNMITMVDYNRAGTALVEIVTEPDFENPRQVRDFLEMMSNLLENLGVSDPRLEGAMRADANVSIEGGKKVEIKNIGSFYELEKAVRFELARQQNLHSRGMQIAQETRHWDDKRRITVSSRSKEEEHDYRYFLEGDIPRIIIDSGTRSKLKKGMPEGIDAKKNRYVSEYGISPQAADVLASDKFHSDLFEKAHGKSNAKEIANIITTDLMGLVDTREKKDDCKVTAAHLREMADAIISGDISRSLAKTALYEIVKTGKQFAKVVAEKDLGNVTDESSLSKVIEKIVKDEQEAVRQTKSNPQAINFLVGKVMKETGGKADPNITLALLKKEISKVLQ